MEGSRITEDKGVNFRRRAEYRSRAVQGHVIFRLSILLPIPAQIDPIEQCIVVKQEAVRGQVS